MYAVSISAPHPRRASMPWRMHPRSESVADVPDFTFSHASASNLLFPPQFGKQGDQHHFLGALFEAYTHSSISHSHPLFCSINL